jgi:hypothetical protein
VTCYFWFAAATENIARIELPRIQAEIEAHVDEATQAYEQTGLARLEAEARAVQDLGDPKKAARGFERTHLTQSNWSQLEWLTKPSWPTWLTWFMVIWIFGSASMFFTTRETSFTQQAIFLAGAMMFLLEQIIRKVLSKKLSPLELARTMCLVTPSCFILGCELIFFVCGGFLFFGFEFLLLRLVFLRPKLQTRA